MEFWGVEVKGGEPLPVSPGENMVLHLSQACLGEAKKVKGNDSVNMFVNIDGKRLVLGTLFSEKLPQQQFDLVFDRDFELSHNWKNGSVYFYGYKANNPFDESDGSMEDSSDESEDDLPALPAINGKPVTEVQEGKSSSVKANAVKENTKVKIVEPNKKTEPKDEDSDESDDLMSEDEFSDDESDSEEEEEENDKEEEGTPKKVALSKKRPAESAIKTPKPDKKAKVTPQKTDGKKGAGGHVATPHPSKQAGKTPGNKPNQQSPKSGGSHSCKPCNRSFGTEQALEAHNKAKHSAGK